MEEKLKKISDIEDFSRMGFHFSDSEEKIQSIIKKGLIPLIGDNSAAFEATPKISFSLGLDGLFQTANRFLNLAQTMPLSFFITETHEKYLPEHILSKDLDHVMTTVEALEFIKNYFENSAYFVFNASPTKYENEITPENISQANEDVKKVMGIPFINDVRSMLVINYDDLSKRFNISVKKAEADEPEQNLYDTVRTIQDCLDSYYGFGLSNMSTEQLKEYSFLVEAKNNAIMKIMEVSRESLKSGEEVEDGLYDQISFHEQKLKWRDQHERPLNVQTRVKIKDGKLVEDKGVPAEDIGILSIDGVHRANNLEVLTELSHNSQLHQRALAEDFDLVSLLVEYAKIPDGKLEEYISSHPDFATQLMNAQNHAKSAMEKQNAEKKETSREQLDLPEKIGWADSIYINDNDSDNDIER